ncbi:MAG: type IX secretion system membrane protein PorP/SprF [Flavobacteriales bacterium]|jgi:type IX secretion system PorP/SprF family membrane protein|nr:type IX secretion system membrane protein PorP/SprF [Flavobacteriales bacterium]MBT3963999.1 type IX secretion system membrane protein PorP/SprF [Flavobacteriales bacterium]MBT4703894.1 type IX secretion system membrane protein PorP/SprF [Flavobacteriales bacterium]MBT4931051.1 type IX secretion system membrane protein PorP/SprF [Flavobacteriales bacterium]MBT5133541.1 type IX secretion system membrane protein PorP/SprF [Flavobacteriales bacterium]
MKNIRHILVLVVLVFFGYQQAKSQQIYQFSQYLQNLYLLNTASGGIHNYTEVNLSYRNQWVGITNSPTTFYVSANAPIGSRVDVKPISSSVRISNVESYNSIVRKSYHDIGGYIARDGYGPYAQTMGALSYAFHLPVAKEIDLSFSPSIGFSSVVFDATKAEVEYAGDPTYINYIGTRDQSSQMDINVAFWLEHPKFFFGYSSDQLIQERLKLSNQVTFEDIKAHHNIIGGYHFKLVNYMELTPSILVKYVDQAPLSFDLNLRLDMREMYWVGLSYRNSNSLVGMIGLHLSNTLRFGYAFDLSLSTIQTNNIGSHEVMLGLNLFNKEKAVF